jgi:hypothetical protein
MNYKILNVTALQPSWVAATIGRAGTRWEEMGRVGTSWEELLRGGIEWDDLQLCGTGDGSVETVWGVL